MSAKGQFLSNLLGTYGSIMLGRARQHHEEEIKGKEAEMEVLKSAISSGRLTDEAMQAAFTRMQEITQEIGGKKGKGKGFDLKAGLGRLIGRFPGEKPRTLEETIGGGAPTPQRPAAAAQATTTGQIPVRGGGPVAAPPEETAAAPTLGVPPTRPGIFKSQQEIFDEKFAQEKRIADYQHKQRLDEIEKQYGEKLTFRSKVSGAGVPPYLNQDSAGNPIDRSGKTPYTLAERHDGTVVAAIPEYRAPERPTGPEAKIESMAKNIMADAEAKGKPITYEQALIQSRQMALQDARTAFFVRLESLKGREFANRIRRGIETGTLTPPQARAFMSYVMQEARWRYSNDPDAISRGVAPRELEEEIYQELGTSREQIATFARAGAKAVPLEKLGRPTPFRFDSTLAPK